MKKTFIDISTWKGKKHYEWFIRYPVHYYNVTKEINISKFLSYLKGKTINDTKVSFFIAFLYIVTKGLNEIEEMHLRIQNGKVIKYDLINPAYTIMTDAGVFENCDNEYDEDFKTFYLKTKTAIDKIKHSINDFPYNNLNEFNQFYMTCLPWIDFTGLFHPMPNDDSAFVPRICWSKYYERNGETFIALNIQVSHALVDGYPLSQAFIKVEEYLNMPEILKL